jgi:cephalosporin hydroxylase
MSVTSFFSYKGLMIQQHINVESSIRKLIQTVKPNTILEIGTASGGLSLMIRDILNELGLYNSNLITYDVNNPEYLYGHLNNEIKIDIRVKNIFNHPYSNIVDKEEIEKIFNTDGPIIVFCDGGSKKNEFNILSKYLRPGDVILAHDYAKNEEFFLENLHGKIWDWLEITDNDIQDCVKRENLVPYLQDEFTNVVWVCKMKEK